MGSLHPTGRPALLSSRTLPSCLERRRTLRECWMVPVESRTISSISVFNRRDSAILALLCIIALEAIHAMERQTNDRLIGCHAASAHAPGRIHV